MALQPPGETLERHERLTGRAHLRLRRLWRESRATASSSVEGYPAAHAIDGSLDTRWAARGRDEWIQFRLDPSMATDSMVIRWFAADKRQAKFEVLYSDDGKTWTAVRNLRAARETVASEAESIDIFQ